MEIQQSRFGVNKYSDQILTMEGWLKSQLGCGDRQHVLNILRMLYKDEYDEEDESLREI